MKFYSSYREYRIAWNTAYLKTPAIPLNLDLELSSICNLKCPFCLITDKKYRHITKNNPKFFPLEYAIRIINQASEIGIPAIKFNWIGEPTLHPDFNLILKYAKAKGFYDILVNTNGNYKICKNEGLIYTTKLVYSIDSFNYKTYNKMRYKGNLERVISNIRDLIDRGHKNIIVRRVITKENENENYKKFAKSIFDDKVKTSQHYVFKRKIGKEKQRNNKQNLRKFSRLYCGYPGQRLVIDTNLDVWPCCADYRRTMKLGNLRKDSILKIWYSDKLNDIREQLMKGRIYVSQSCQDCRSYMAYNHPYREQVSK